MPEGPSILILKEAITKFKGKKILAAGGYGKIDMDRLENQVLENIRTWGKHLLLCLPKLTIRIHLLLFGKYTIDEKLKNNPVLSLTFQNGTLYFYTCSVKVIEENLNEIYDWTADIMNKKWDAEAARKKLAEEENTWICDTLLNQNIFSGSGNIFKNEVLFRTRVHPKSPTSKIPARKRAEIVRQMHTFAFDFLKWKKADVLKKNCEVYTKKTCPRCDIPLVKEYLGQTKRRTFYCRNCQELYK